MRAVIKQQANGWSQPRHDTWQHLLSRDPSVPLSHTRHDLLVVSQVELASCFPTLLRCSVSHSRSDAKTGAWQHNPPTYVVTMRCGGPRGALHSANPCQPKVASPCAQPLLQPSQHASPSLPYPLETTRLLPRPEPQRSAETKGLSQRRDSKPV